MQDVKALEIPLPPLDEQRRIVDVLNRAARIERLRAQAAFGSGETAGNEWPSATVARLVADRKGSIRTGPFGSQLKHSEFVDRGVPVLGIDNVVANRFRWAKLRCLPPDKFAKFTRYRVYPGD